MARVFGKQVRLDSLNHRSKIEFWIEPIFQISFFLKFVVFFKKKDGHAIHIFFPDRDAPNYFEVVEPQLQLWWDMVGVDSNEEA
eukprot:SAG31_NODE_147_length_22539_cov_37.073663_16_plen_84_part_00